MNCSKCKATLSLAAKFCTNCGTKANPPTSTTVAPKPVATQSAKPTSSSSSGGTTYCTVCGEPIIGKSCRTCDAKSSITGSAPAATQMSRPPSVTFSSNPTQSTTNNLKKCPKCGTSSSSKVCTSCGEKLDQPSSVTTSSSSSGTKSRPTSTSMPAPVKTTTSAPVSSTKTVDNSNSSSSSFKCQRCSTMNATKFCSKCGEKIIENGTSNSTTSAPPSKHSQPNPSPRSSLTTAPITAPSPTKTTPSTATSTVASSPSSSSSEKKCPACSTLNVTKFCTACGVKIDEPYTPSKPSTQEPVVKQTPPPPPAKQTVPPPPPKQSAPPSQPAQVTPPPPPPKQTTPPPPPAKQAIPPPPPKNSVPPPPPPKQTSWAPAKVPPPPPKNTVPPPPPAKKAIPPPPSTPKPPPPNTADDPKLKQLLEENDRLKKQLEDMRKEQLKEAQTQPLTSSQNSVEEPPEKEQANEPAERSWKKKLGQARALRESSDSVSSSDSAASEGSEDPQKHRSWKKKYETIKSTSNLTNSGNAGETTPRKITITSGGTVRHKSFTDSNLPPRERVTREIVDTEIDYVADLETIVNVFLNPMRKEQTATPDEIIGIFSNIEYILAVNKQLLEDLQSNGGKNIGTTFLKKKDYLRVYSTYCSNQQTSHDIMQKLLKKEKKFESFLQYTYARPECQGLDLGSFMIKPIQRICKYPLLMKELLKQTDAAHEEYQQTKDALQAIEDLLSQINEKKRDAESVQKVIELTKVLIGAEGHRLVEPTRRYIKEGDITRYDNNKKEQEGYFFLFNDVFIFSKRKGSNKFKLLAFIALKTADIRVAVTYEKPCFELINTVDNSVWPLIMNSQDQVVSFMSELQTLIDKEQNRGSTRQSVKTQKLDDTITFECEYTEKKSVYMNRDKFTYEDLYYAIADQFGVQAITIMYGENYVYSQQDLDSILAEGKSFYQVLIYDYYDYSNSYDESQYQQ